MQRKLLDDCFLHDKDRLRHDEALALLQQRIAPVAGTETLPLGDAAGRTLAQSIIAPRPVPAYDNAAVDGYAFAHADYAALGGRLKITRRIAAGHPSQTPIEPGCAARIFTGAAMPAGADTVAMQEDVRVGDEGGWTFAAIPAGLKQGANRRKAGEDLAQGAQLMGAGHRLRPQDVAAIASTGLAEVACFAPLKVALVSTGDEIVRPGNPLATGQVYDSNHYLLRALLAPLACAITDLGVLEDRADVVRAQLQAAAATHDVVLTTGGASRGEEDHIVKAIDALGTLAMWQLAIKPGRPMSFGQIGDSIFLGLPGNPVAVMVCFLLYVRPLLIRLGGAAWHEPQRYPLPAAFTLTKKAGRREFLRGMVVAGPDGGVRVDKYERDGSGLISSLRAAGGLIEIPEETVSIKPGNPVAFIPFAELGLQP